MAMHNTYRKEHGSLGTVSGAYQRVLSLTVSKRVSVYLAALLLSAATFCAQSVGSVRISVKDQDWQAPINEAQVTLVEKNLKQVTTPDGQTLFENIESGRYTFSVSASGFERKILSSIVVIAGRVEAVECTLQAMYTDMDEFVIKDLDLALGNTDVG